MVPPYMLRLTCHTQHHRDLTCQDKHVRIFICRLRHGLLDLLAGEPMSGYDLARFFGASMGNVWPAQHSQIYPELAKLVAEGLIAQTGEGARGRKVYETTPAGHRGSSGAGCATAEPDYSFRNEALLRVFCLWVLPTDEALASPGARPGRVRPPPRLDRERHRHPGLGRQPGRPGQPALHRVRPALLRHADRLDRLGHRTGGRRDTRARRCAASDSSQP